MKAYFQLQAVEKKVLSIKYKVLHNLRCYLFIGVLFATSLILNTKYFIPEVHAQVSGVSGIANNLPVADLDAKPGDIVVQNDKGIVRSTKPFDPQMIGVILEFPVISAGQKTDSTRSILSSGQAVVNVTASKGEIKEGDLITASDKPGVGQKAEIAGFVLGRALAGYNNTSQDGQIPVIINIGPNAIGPNVGGTLASLLGALALGFQNTQNFPLVLRYLLATLIVLVTFIISSFSFVRFMRDGLEAIGRNPFAKATIISGMVLNAVIVGVLTLAGFGIAVAIVAF